MHLVKTRELVITADSSLTAATSNQQSATASDVQPNAKN